MAKAKNKRNSGLADKVHQKRKNDGVKKKINPFEVHINREKIKVLGQKSKHDRGLPGVSRAKALQKRKETLGTELKLMNKTNTFIDKRIGEKDSQLSSEDRILARFAAERAKQHSKQNIYNLADDEVLTHRGQTLEQIEKFDDPRSSDEEDDDDRRKFGGLDEEFVSEGHFGGGVLSKTDSKDGAKSHKDLIEQLIAESKKRKAEKQKEKEQTLDLTEKLDSEWKDLQPVVLKRARVEEPSAIDKVLSKAEQNGIDYDKAMRELRFDKRGTPSDGLESAEKKAKEEAQKVEQLERERARRMVGDEPAGDQPPPPSGRGATHRSAEELDDNFALDEDAADFMLAYDKDGNPLVPEHVLKANHVPNSKKQFEDGVSDSSSDEEETDEDDDDDDSADEDEGEEEDQRGQQEAALSDDDQTNTEEKEHLKNDDSESDANENGLFAKNDSDNNIFVPSDDENSADEDSAGNDDQEEQDSDEPEDEEQTKRDEEQIGSFFSQSDSRYQLKELVRDKSPAQQSAALRQLIASYDPSRAEHNKDLLSRLFADLLHYINELFTGLKTESDVIKAFLVFDKVAPHLYDLAHSNKVMTKKHLVEVLKEKHNLFRRNIKRVPDLDTLIFFKVVSLLYPTSDHRHPAATPALVFMSEILNLCRYRDAYSITRGLFVTALVLEYTALSKRFVPSALNFLRGVVYLSANASVLDNIQVVPPFKLHRDAKLLHVSEHCSAADAGDKMAARDLVAHSIDDGLKVRCVTAAAAMAAEMFAQWEGLEARAAAFSPLLRALGRVEVAGRVRDAREGMLAALQHDTFTPLSRARARPRALRQYEPDVQAVFSASKAGKQSREEAEASRLRARLKRETKGARRELRRDAAYLAQNKLHQKILSDNLRKEKVKQIYKEAAIQQGELNKFKRMK